MSKSTIGKSFAKYVSLNVFGMIGLSCYILADTVFVARSLGSHGLTALNLAIPVYSLIHGLGLMIGMGGGTRFSILAETGDQESRNKVFTQAFYSVVIMSLILVLAGLFLPKQIARLLGADVQVLQMTASYIRIILLFAPMFMGNNLCICFIRNDGNPRLSMAGMMIGSLSNIILDYVFLFPMKMGMAGAALATGIAPVVSLLVLSKHYRTKTCHFKLAITRLECRRIVDILTLGVNSFIMELSSGVVIIVFNILILGLLGNVGVAAYGVVANIALIVLSIFTGLGQGIQPLLSINYGQGNQKNIRKVYRYAIICAIVFAVSFYAVTYLSADSMVTLFNKEQDPYLAEIAVRGMDIYFIGFIFAGINVVTATYFSSMDGPKHAFAISFLRGFLLIVPLAVLLSKVWGMTGIWLAFPASELLVCLGIVMERMGRRRIKRSIHKKN